MASLGSSAFTTLLYFFQPKLRNSEETRLAFFFTEEPVLSLIGALLLFAITKERSLGFNEHMEGQWLLYFLDP